MQAQTEEAVNADNLRILTGISLDQPIAAEDLLLQVPVQDEIRRFSESTIAQRPELAQFAAQKLSASFEEKAARAERRPQVTYSVSSGFITDSLTPGPVKNHAGVQTVIGVTIPIFDWGGRRSRIAQAKLRTQVADNDRVMAERRFALEFYAARTQAMAAEKRIEQARSSIADAETNVTASTARYRAGETTITEVVDSQNLLISQRQALYQALYDYQTAKYRLSRAAGR